MDFFNPLLSQYFHFRCKNGKNSRLADKNRPAIDRRGVKESQIERNGIPRSEIARWVVKKVNNPYKMSQKGLKLPKGL
jgi:hypothetical protein